MAMAKAICIGLVVIFLIAWVYTEANPDPAYYYLDKEIAPGMFLDNKGNLIRDKIPSNLPEEMEICTPVGQSRITLRWLEWARVTCVDRLHPRVARYEPILYWQSNRIFLANGTNIITKSEPKVIKLTVAADIWWRQTRPGKIQGVVEFAVWPWRNEKEITIIQYTFS